MNQTVEDRLEPGRDAHRRHAWGEAFEIFTAADAERPLGAGDLVLLAESAWFAGDPDAAIEARERAHAAYVADGDKCRAAEIALDLAMDYSNRMQHAISNGWMSRASRLLDGTPECRAHGVQAIHLAVMAIKGLGDLELGLAQAREARAIADRLDDASIRAMAVQLEGMAEVGLGRVDAGMALIDEATIAAVNGELDPMTTGIVYCMTIGVCSDTGDWGRAGEWTDAAEKWCSRTGISGFPGVCRVHRAEVMHLRGSWADAEREARQACEELQKYNLMFSARGYYEVGEVRRRVGDLEGARTAFREALDLGLDPEPGMSLVRLAEGDLIAAEASIRRALAAAPSVPLERVRFLPAVIDIGLAAGDLEQTRAAITELREITSTYPTASLRGITAYAEGELALAEERPGEAEERFRRSIASWREIGAPYEVARAQTGLGRAYRASGDEAGARLEFESVKAVFEKLGAIGDARDVDVLLGGSGEVALRAGERVTRTFVFTDIVGSTNLAEAVGDEAWQEMLHWHDMALRGVFDRFGGKEVRHTGDGFFIVFDTASAAADAAVTIQRTLEEHRKAHGFAPQVRIGLHLAEASARATDYAGKGVHAAARIGALAGAGEILASAPTVAGLRYPTSAPRTESLKGLAEPVDVVSIGWR